MNTKTYGISKYDSYQGEVVRETTAGCILVLDLGNGLCAPAYAHGNFSAGDILRVTVIKCSDPDRYPLTYVDSVITYAADKAA